MPRTVRYLNEGYRASDEARGEAPPKGGYKAGGRVSSFPKIKDGAGSAAGRLEKIRAYGTKSK